MSEPLDMTPIRTRLIRSNLCRTFRVDGAWGGLTPQGGIHMAMFSERWSTPAETLIKLDEGQLIDLADPEKSERVLIREIEADAFLSEESAVSLVNWLNGHISKLRELKRLQEGAEE